MSGWPHYLDSKQNIILFDGVCILCTGWVKFLLKYDKQPHYQLASVQSPVGQDLLRYADMSIDVFDTLVVIEQGRVTVRSDAILRVLHNIGMPWSLTKVFKVLPQSLRDFIYHYIATNRYKVFGKHSSCYVASQGDMKRFLKKPQPDHV